MDSGELTLQSAYTTGEAYFLDRGGHCYRAEGCSCKLTRTDELYVHAGLEQCVLAEPGRRFAQVQEAEQYIVTIIIFERLIEAARTLADPGADRELLQKFFYRSQRHLGAAHLDALNTISAFQNRAHYLRATPEEIALHLLQHPPVRPLL